MNIRKIGSALSVGLVLVTMLSLCVLPAFVEARSGYRHEKHEKGDWNWNIIAGAHAYWDDYYIVDTSSSSTYHSATGGVGISATTDYYEDLETSEVVFSAIEATFKPTGLSAFHAYAESWVRPAYFPQQWGGYAERW
ncbi:MAG: hypothetical protein LBE76_07695 [Nitrososphaerota archaeon]|jgi:hypothetical protein|nr:hypothetical protein [Nitrososphaerota archaeon]